MNQLSTILNFTSQIKSIKKMQKIQNIRQKMILMANRKFIILVTKDPDEGYTGKCLEIPAAISEGNTIEELKENMTEAIQLVLETIEKDYSTSEKIVIEIPNQV